MPSLSFIPESLDLALYAGDGCAVRIVVRNKATQGEMDISGQYVAQIRAAKLAPDVVDEFSIDTSEAPHGAITISLTGDQTANLGDNFRGVWDLQWTGSTANAQPVTLIQGKITCVTDVSRPEPVVNPEMMLNGTGS